MSYHTGIVEAYRDHGLTVRLWPGWETRGSSLFWPRCHVCHHDAIDTRYAWPPPIFADGRPDLAGPIANDNLNAAGEVTMIAAGRANHAGAGSWHGIVGNSSAWGTEAQNAGTGQEWPDAQIDAYVRMSAALAEYFGFTPEMVCRHAEWAPTRKIDPWGPWQDGHRWELDASHFRALVARGGTGAEMTTEEWEKLGDWMQDQTRNVIAAVDTATGELRDEVRADRRMMLDIIDATSSVAGVDPAKVRARLRPETRTALDKVD